MVNLQKVTLAGGCFWCTEAIFKRIKGVNAVTSGYAGEGKEAPTYEEVSSGTTNFHEAIQIEYDETVTPFEKLLEIFFKTHDPTSFDRQGADAGPQYRSIIYFHTKEQEEIAMSLIKALDAGHVFKQKIVTEVSPFKQFYEAESYHKNFYERNKDYPYCQVVINPKIEKLVSEFSSELKNGE